MAGKRHILPAAVFSATLLAFCVIVFWLVFERPHGTSGTIVAIIAQFGVWVPFGIALALAVAASTCKPLRSRNYPRIEHLRIAGKYQGTSANMSGKEYHWSMGSSPLHLRG